MSVLSLGWAHSFSLGPQKWGEPGLAPPLGLLRLSDTLLGKTRGIREGSEKRVSAPSQRRGTSPGASKWEAGDARDREPECLLCEATASQALQSQWKDAELGHHGRRGGRVHSLFSLQGPGCASGFHSLLGGTVGSLLSGLRRDRVLGNGPGLCIEWGMNSGHVWMPALRPVGSVET